MAHLIEFPIEHYAVLKGLENDGRRERFVIAYRDEQSLRELFAAPCILATGFCSRDEATQACGVELLSAIA